MAFKVFFLVFSCATLALAKLPSELQKEYEELTTKQSNQLIVTYFHETDPLKIEVNWDLFLGGALLILEKGKQQAILSAGKNAQLVESIKKVWNSVQEAGVKGQFEVRDIIDGLRDRALQYAPAEWDQVAQMSQQLLAAFKKAAKGGNPYEVRKTLTTCTNSFRQAKVKLEKIIASRTYGA